MRERTGRDALSPAARRFFRFFLKPRLKNTFRPQGKKSAVDEENRFEKKEKEKENLRPRPKSQAEHWRCDEPRVDEEPPRKGHRWGRRRARGRRRWAEVQKVAAGSSPRGQAQRDRHREVQDAVLAARGAGADSKACRQGQPVDPSKGDTVAAPPKRVMKFSPPFLSDRLKGRIRQRPERGGELRCSETWSMPSKTSRALKRLAAADQ